MIGNIEWVPVRHDGLVWRRQVRPTGRLVGGIVFYPLRGSQHASFWRAMNEAEEWRSCFTRQEAIDWAEISPVPQLAHVSGGVL